MDIVVTDFNDIDIPCAVDFASCKKYTESYRGVPSSYVPPRCSGRTELCNEVRHHHM